MTPQEDLFTKAVELCTQIHSLSMKAEDATQPQKRLIVSFDVYCVLLEYTIFLQTMRAESGMTLEEYLQCDDLVFDANGHRLDVRVDFFLSPGSILID
jgi:hypothetical protein